MAVIETWLEQDLQAPVKVRYLDGNLFSNNGNGNRVGVRVYNNGEAVTLSGTVSGYVVVADGSTVPCTGSRSGNQASILIPPAAYQPGAVFISVFLTDGSTVTTLAAVSTTVMQTRTNSQVSPGSVVTDWTQTINAAMQSVVDANAANMAQTYGELSFPVPMGKYTLYNDLLYRCITPIATSESWTAAHWTRVKLADDVSDLKSALNLSTDTEIFYFDDGHTIKTNGAIGTEVDLSNLRTSEAMGCSVMSCVENDAFVINGEGASTARLWCLLDSDNLIIDRAGGSATETGLIISITGDYANAKKLVLNTKIASRGICCKKIPLPQRIDDLRSDCEDDHEELNDKIVVTRKAIDDSTETEVIYFTDGETITTNGEVGSIVDLVNKNTSATMGYAVVNCAANDVFTITGHGGTSSRLWCFIDSEDKIISRSGSSATEINSVITAPSGAAKLILNTTKDGRGLCCKGLSLKIRQDNLDETDTNQQNALDVSTGEEIVYSYIKKGRISTDSSPVDINTIIQANNYTCAVLDCEEGNKFTVTGNGGNNSRLWAFIDDEGEILSNEEVNANVSNKVITAPAGSDKVIFNFDTSVKYMACKNVSMLVRVADLEQAVFQPSNLHKQFDCSGLPVNEYYPGLCQSYSLFGKDTVYSDFISAIDSLVSGYSGYITKSDLGVSSDGTNHLYSYDLNPIQHAPQYDPSLEKSIPKIIIVAGQHGFEKSNCLSLYYFIKDLLENYTQNSILDYLRNHVHLIIVPCANPYGFNEFEYKNANGVNLNRNYDANWKKEDDPTASSYAGEAPFDQPETQHIRDLVLANLDTFYLVDWHTNSESNVTSQFSILWHSLLGINEPYLSRLAYAANYHVNHITAHFRKEYGEGVDDSLLPWGHVTYGLSHGLLKQWAANQGIVSSTFEGFNGFWFTEQDFTPDVKKANSELIGNWIMAVLNEYGKNN